VNEYKEGDLEKFFGCAPDFTGELSTEEYVDDIRSGGKTTEMGKRIAELEAENQRLREAGRWIPVGERLPEKEGSYLVSYYGGKFTSYGYFNGKRFSGESRIVSAWREMPEPYQGIYDERINGGGFRIVPTSPTRSDETSDPRLYCVRIRKLYRRITNLGMGGCKLD
jgi:hypothetical protein